MEESRRFQGRRQSGPHEERSFQLPIETRSLGISHMPCRVEMHGLKLLVGCHTFGSQQCCEVRIGQPFAGSSFPLSPFSDLCVCAAIAIATDLLHSTGNFRKNARPYVPRAQTICLPSPFQRLGRKGATRRWIGTFHKQSN